MKLKELEQFNPITIQCHDNPDADALASGFGLYTYFKEKGKDVRLIYAGSNRIQKKNLLLMIEKLEIPIVYLEDIKGVVEGLLITVDCQYGAGNVTKLKADEVAIVDHHQLEITNVALMEVRPNLGSCSTLVWRMMRNEGFSFAGKEHLGTALYYGLLSDTNQFAEIYNPLDMDMRDTLPCEKSLINLFRNSNLSLHELEIAGLALIKHIYNEDYRYAIIKANPCDPNLLGLISDFLLQVDGVDTCIVYNELKDGYKFSVRSCVKEVRADELASYLAGDLGSGGGHKEKAGGFLRKSRYSAQNPFLQTEVYFSEKMNEYFDNCLIINAWDYDIDISDMQAYVRRKLPEGYVHADEVMPIGTPITIRTHEGDLERVIEDDMILMIGIKGEVYPIKQDKFDAEYQCIEENYVLEKHAIQSDYAPTIHNRVDGSTREITRYAKVCTPREEKHIHARELKGMVKVFSVNDKEKYMLGRTGDFLAVCCEDRHDIFVVQRDVFFASYEEMSEK